ncbi:hypothetical protein F4776DRAFT_355043 [Hypoxylon sp. NC0597]|nr:hypothetical protein F4776DRAFT_355043 [Hypoxylon sp. NC0597]
MSGSLTETFVERSRSERKAELARLTQDNNENQNNNLGLVLGFSSQFNGSQAHLDYIGGLDTRKPWTSLAKLVQPTRWKVRFEGAEPAKGDQTKTLPSLRDALLDVAPLDLRQKEGEGERERKRKGFKGILDQIDTQAIASFARDILRNRRKLVVKGRRAAAPLRLPRVRGPMFGSAHVFYSIEFFDRHEKNRDSWESKPSVGTTEARRTKWIIKVPVNGTPDTWDQLSAETLRTEALVLYMLATETSMPVPEIIDADSSPHNQIHVPYLIMEFVDGQALDEVWFGLDGEDEESVRERRTRVLRGLARAMLQLGKYEFERGGAPVFDGGGALVGVGPLRELDVQAMIDRWLGNEDCERAPVYAAIGPFAEPAELYTALLDLYPCDAEANTGVDRLLRMLVQFIREPSAGPKSYNSEGLEKGKGKGKEMGKQKMGFVLTHPGLNMRDVIVSERGDVRGILGWDGVRVAPRSLGNEALPHWLVRDFNPFVWRWRPAPEFWSTTRRSNYEEESEGVFGREDAPWVLRGLRDEYADIVQEMKREQQGRDGGLNRDGGVHVDADADAKVNVTKQSLLALSLDAAVKDPRCRTAVLRRILAKCSRMSEEFDFDRIVEVLGRGGYLDGYKLKCLERNFRELVERGYVRGAVVW